MSGVDVETLRWYVDTPLRLMLHRARLLGDELVSVAPDLPGANSVFAIVTHCCGVMEHWAGEVIAGRPVERDRDAEFVATGTVRELERRVAEQRARFARDLADYDALAAPRGRAELGDDAPDPVTQGFVLLHVVEELYQHAGHVDLTADLVRHSTRAVRGAARPGEHPAVGVVPPPSG